MAGSKPYKVQLTDDSIRVVFNETFYALPPSRRNRGELLIMLKRVETVTFDLSNVSSMCEDWLNLVGKMKEITRNLGRTFIVEGASEGLLESLTLSEGWE